MAGFSAILVGLSGNTGRMEPPEKFRIMALVYGSLGAVFLALLPFVVFSDETRADFAWTICGSVLFIYTAGGLTVLPPRSVNLRKTYPELFPLPLILTQTTGHIIASLLALAVVLNFSDYRANLYTGSLLILMFHGAISFIRTLFFRRNAANN